MVVRDWQEGRAEVVQMWGRTESVRTGVAVRDSFSQKTKKSFSAGSSSVGFRAIREA